jgi:hypothetical protein
MLYNQHFDNDCKHTSLKFSHHVQCANKEDYVLLRI